jgi:exocyst complex component 7
VEPDRLFDCLPSSLRPSSESPSHPPETGKNSTNGNQSEKQEIAVYTPPTLIDPRFVPLLSKLAQQLVQAGHHAQCLKLYRSLSLSIVHTYVRVCIYKETMVSTRIEVCNGLCSTSANYKI